MTIEDERALALAALRVARPRQFEVIQLHRQGLQQRAIADAMGVTQGRVSQMIKQATNNLEKLRERIATAAAGKRNNT